MHKKLQLTLKKKQVSGTGKDSKKIPVIRSISSPDYEKFTELDNQAF